MAAGLAHEIRSPLAAVKAAVEVLRDTEHFSNEGREITFEIDAEIRKVDRVLQQFLDFTTEPAPNMEPVFLDVVVDAVREMLPDGAENIRVSRLPASLQLRCDAAMLQSVLFELLQNGVEHGGGPVQLRVNSGGNKVQIEIRNKRRVMEPEVVSNLFRPFFSTVSGRAGLGLCIVARRLAAMKGSIRVLPGRKGFEITLVKG
ncbi:MAG TPA: HAMP domain-containing sensor histidine kinase [Acidobacteriota bacterium]|jgi:signal transduction histidine kinase